MVADIPSPASCMDRDGRAAAILIRPIGKALTLFVSSPANLCNGVRKLPVHCEADTEGFPQALAASGPATVEAALAKRRKKNAAKDHRYLPAARREG